MDLFNEDLSDQEKFLDVAQHSDDYPIMSGIGPTLEDDEGGMA